VWFCSLPSKPHEALGIKIGSTFEQLRFALTLRRAVMKRRAVEAETAMQGNEHLDLGAWVAFQQWAGRG